MAMDNKEELQLRQSVCLKEKKPTEALSFVAQ